MTPNCFKRMLAGAGLATLGLTAVAQTWSSPDYARRPSYTTNFRYSTPIAVNKPLARDMAQGIADKYALRLVYMGPDDLRIDGPITLLGKTAEQDSELFARALGGNSPVVVEVDPRDRLLKVVPRGMSDRDIARMRNPLPNDPILALDRSVSALKPLPGANGPVPAVLTLVVRQGEPLESAVSRFARTQGFALQWRVKSKYESKTVVTIDGTSVPDVLRQLLPPLGLKPEIDDIDHVIVVTPQYPGQDQ